MGEQKRRLVRVAFGCEARKLLPRCLLGRWLDGFCVQVLFGGAVVGPAGLIVVDLADAVGLDGHCLVRYLVHDVRARLDLPLNDDRCRDTVY